ncbi:MAG: AraC family transcriptional regulator [Bacteroidota bacterium]
MHLSKRHFEGRKLENLVENQTTYLAQHAELHIFETHQQAEQVLLTFNEPILASMIQGKKVMHLRDYDSFEFVPGESLVLPSNEVMCIDFPDARRDTPTMCSAMAISEDKLHEVVMFMNETMPKVDNKEWRYMDYNFHFTNNAGIYQLLQRLFFLFTENHQSKDYFVNLILQELIVRVLQSDSKNRYLTEALNNKTDTRLGFIIEYIRKHLHENLTIQELSTKAYMSESNFYRVFKHEMGMSPVDFINQERIKLASALLQNPRNKIKEVFRKCGFESRSYFNRVFKKMKGISPREYQIQQTQIIH